MLRAAFVIRHFSCARRSVIEDEDEDEDEFENEDEAEDEGYRVTGIALGITASWGTGTAAGTAPGALALW